MTTDALARTARLLQLDFFGSLTEEEIGDGLRARKVQIRVAPGAADTRAGQDAVATTALLVSQLGAAVAIEMDEVELLARQPPFAAAGGLRASLLDGSQGLIAPFIAGRHRRPDVEVRIGSLRPSREATISIGVAAGDWDCGVGPEVEGVCGGELPFGATLAAISVAAECTRAAIASIATEHGIDLGEGHHLGPPCSHRLSLPEVPLGDDVDLGAVDVVSAGAITNGFLAVLLRVPGVTARLRLFDDDLVELTNMNRCGLFTRASIDEPKVSQLASYGDETLAIEGIRRRFDPQAVAELGRPAPRLVVGVDHVPSRWFVQRTGPEWLGVAGTSHLDVIASEHQPGMPCVGCLHPTDEEVEGPLPTISFVSALAGLLLCHRLLAAASGRPPALPLYAWGLALHEPRGITEIGLHPDRRCPVRCPASRALSG